ncbi:hypothetical protein HHK36_016912 [Tetracentron sinense]|uniref:t-SNARE coiled-coil homology domain-containing protein n=1 Tax=Tetracentron sinense TaxID=13715 RepID=A0A834Z666_TETSI|nr:hypothetical protein HHK36_016912 [Tetracentron sinense]
MLERKRNFNDPFISLTMFPGSGGRGRWLIFRRLEQERMTAGGPSSEALHSEKIPSDTKSSQRLEKAMICVFFGCSGDWSSKETQLNLLMLFHDEVTIAPIDDVNVRESLWQSLEENMVPSFPTIKTNWLEPKLKFSSKKYKESNVCVAGEAIKVDIEFKNPLQISISISGVSLVCELSARSEAMESELDHQYVSAADAHRSTTGLQDDPEFRKLTSIWELNSGISSLTLSDADFSLGGGETIVVQLMVTPKVEGILKIVGLRWKLSDSVVGYHDFDSNLVKKKIMKGRRKATQSSSNNLDFIVIKSLPKLEGLIHHLPKRTYAGDFRRLMLELRNQSEFPVKNMKMKISHPRFLNIGSQEDMNIEFPAGLEKQKNYKHSGVQANAVIGSTSLFSFPEDMEVQGGTPFLWPLWLRAADSGDISLDISIYYEMGDLSGDMRYRTLRMHYTLEVSPSMDVSVQISPCPSRFQEFLVRMDVVNRTSSESFRLLQLSSVGFQWEILSLQRDSTVCPSQLLVAGQALSCFFKLKNRRKSATSEDNVSSLAPLQGSDVKLGPPGSSEALFDAFSSPLADFHHYERLHQGKSIQGYPSTLDFILISQLQKNNVNPGLSNPPELFSHHMCHCSIGSTSPIWWLMDGPRTVNHDFSISVCEIRFRMAIHNSSDAAASIRINTFDATLSTGQSSDAAAAVQSPVSSGNQTGWHDVSLVNDIKVTSDVLGSQFGKSLLPDSVAPFVWSGSSSTRVEVEPMSTTEVPLQICVFSPGTYDLSNYALHWNLQLSNDQGYAGDRTRESSGTSTGHPYYLSFFHADSPSITEELSRRSCKFVSKRRKNIIDEVVPEAANKEEAAVLFFLIYLHYNSPNSPFSLPQSKPISVSSSINPFHQSLRPERKTLSNSHRLKKKKKPEKMNDLFSGSFSRFKSDDGDRQASPGIRDGGVQMGSMGVNLDKFFEDVEGIKDELKEVEKLQQRLQDSHEESKTLHNAKSIKDLRSKMDSDVSLALKKAKLIKVRLESLDRVNAANRSLPGCGPGSSADRTRTSVVSGLRKKLKDSMEGFNTLRQEIASEHKETVERRYFTVTGEKADEKTVEMLISTGESETFLQKAIQEQGRGRVMDTIQEIQERHGAAREMERSLLELQQVFMDMAVLVQAQGEQLDDIESQVGRASSFVRGGTQELQTARKHQRNTRKWTCYAIILLLIITLIIVLPIVIPRLNNNNNNSNNSNNNNNNNNTPLPPPPPQG